jgi:hypothetical protein
MSVTPEFFGALGPRLLVGRTFAPGDPADHVVVDESFAARFWPDGSALGQRFFPGSAAARGNAARQIVGIASHVRAGRGATGEEAYLLYGQLPDSFPSLNFVARLDNASRIGQVTQTVQGLAPDSRVRVTVVDHGYADMDGDARVGAAVTATFATLAFVVAIAGIYGVTAFVVGGRTREIGIRLALGATAAHIRRSIVGPILRVVGAGLAAGVGAALVASRWIETQPVGVTGASPATHLAIAVVLGIAALLAAWRPAREASRVNPAITLRAE